MLCGQLVLGVRFVFSRVNVKQSKISIVLKCLFVFLGVGWGLEQVNHRETCRLAAYQLELCVEMFHAHLALKFSLNITWMRFVFHFAYFIHLPHC